MARRGSKAEGALIIFLLAIGIPIYVVGRIVESIGWIIPIVIVAGAIVAFFAYRQRKTKARLQYLQQKYADDEIVRKILDGYFWRGQTQEQLIDSIGRPLAIDSKVLKSSVREVWKYNQMGKNRYSLRVTLENGIVTGWENKS